MSRNIAEPGSGRRLSCVSGSMSWCLRSTITKTQEALPSPRGSGTATCESQGQPSSCHPGETSEFLPASGDRSGGYPGQRTGRPAAGRVEREVSGPHTQFC